LAAKPDLDFGESIKSRSLVDTLAKLIADGLSHPSQWPKEIVVSRDTLRAVIEWPLDHAGVKTIAVTYSSDGSSIPLGLRVMATVPGGIMLRINRQLYLWQLEKMGEAL
jgi:hypothetical protein